jgi:PAS domain S-box-containing protein
MYGLYISNLIKDESFLNLITSNSSDEQTITLNVGAFEEFYRIYTTDIVDKDSRTIGRLIRLHDITVIQEYTNHLSLVNNELIMTDRIIESAMEGILVTDEKAHIIRVNYALEKMSGFSNIELIGENPRLFKSNVHNSEFYEKMWFELIEYGYWEGEIWDKRKNGELYPKWMSITSLKNEEGEIQNYIAISSDISKMKKAENDLHSLSNYDPLTGLPNKNLFYQKLDDSIIRASETKSSTALIFIGWAIIN